MNDFEDVIVPLRRSPHEPTQVVQKRIVHLRLFHIRYVTRNFHSKLSSFFRHFRHP